jgi:serine/threonine protein kinase
MNSPFFPATAEAEPRAELVFFQALKRPSGERETFLNQECGADPAFRAEVEALLRDHENAGSFLSGDAVVSEGLNTEIAGRLPEEAGERIGPYKLLQQIGEGGCGVVWMAEQEVPVRRRVALKVIKLGMDTKQVIARFEAERQALALMDHPNIAKVLDAGATDAGRPYFVMELVRGIKITKYCDQNNLPTEKRLALFTQVCHAVQHAHQKGIIHRDIKPSNILVTMHDGVPVPKVIDFGIAKATTGQQLTDKTIFTAFEQFIGTPAYMSPEQAEMSGLDIDTRSDIYALGVLLYELLTGQPPFDPKELLAAGLDAMRRTIREQEPPRPSTRLSTMLAADQTTVAKHHQTEAVKLTHSLRGDLDWIVMKALEKDRTRRYESASSLARDIQRHLDDEPVVARPPGRLYRFRKMVRRNKLAFGAVTGISVAILAGSGVSVWQAFRANAALSELRSSAPAFAAMARTLASGEKFDEAVEKLDIAIKLRPEEPEYILNKADILESQFLFSEAAALYRAVMRMAPNKKRAERNAVLCEKLAAELTGRPQLSRASLVELLDVMTSEQRPAAELLRTGRLLGEENKLLLRYWLERLKDLPIPPGLRLDERLTAGNDGHLKLDLSGTDIADLTSLEGMPLDRLLLDGCEHVTNLGPLRGMPLRELSLSYMARDKGVGLDFRRKPCPVNDIAALKGMRLEKLNIGGTYVSDLSALKDMSLQDLSFFDTGVTDLSPLQGMPLRKLVCDRIPGVDFSPLAGAPLTVLSLETTPVGDLSILRGMPLKELYLAGCGAARGYSVLSELNDLAILSLPYDFLQLPREEVAAIETLRNHPKLKVIGPGDFGEFSRSSADEFWKSYDLLKLAGGDRPRIQRDATGWKLQFDGIPLQNLSPLQGLPITRLRITETGVTDLTPLEGMPLETLYAGSNQFTDLTPLGELPLTHLFLDQCPAGLDVSPLASISTLQSVVLPPQARNIDSLRQLPGLKYLSEEFDEGYKRALQTKEDFWNQRWPVTPDRLARAGKFAEAEKLLRENKASTAGYSSIALGTVVFAQRNEPAWQAVCRELMDRSSGVPLDKDKGHCALRACLLAPNCGIPAADIETLTKMLKQQWGGDTFFGITEGLQQFRAGKRERAQNIMISVRDISSLPHASAACTTILAMIRCADGQRDYARQTLDRAREEMRGKWPERARTSIWYEWLTVHLLLQEAEAMIEGDPSGQESK